jgi:hypothetical protein
MAAAGSFQKFITVVVAKHITIQDPQNLVVNAI